MCLTAYYSECPNVERNYLWDRTSRSIVGSSRVEFLKLERGAACFLSQNWPLRNDNVEFTLLPESDDDYKMKTEDG